jgi:hypothetical protein
MESTRPGRRQLSSFLLDERGRPDFRDVFGALARRSTLILTAVTRVRLSTVDLSHEEVHRLKKMHVLISEVSAVQLDAEAKSLLLQPHRAPNVHLLTLLLEQGRLEVRSAPLGGWSPDFTVFYDDERPLALITGFHAFERPYPHRGPALLSVHGPEGARLASLRHQEVWKGAHEIGPVLRNLLVGAERKVAVATRRCG